MADQQFDAQDSQEIKKKRTFKKFTFRGVDLEQLLELSNDQVIIISGDVGERKENN